MKSLLIQEQSSGVKENMSNLTRAASGEFSVSSGNNRAQTEQYFAPPTQIHPQPSVKRKRNQTGNPDPEAEVIALSPKTLMATNRFVCEICNKGFQRDQNLQLHRRGHNLPWKLKQRENKEVMKKKVYVCPEATCVHHDPSRALGDLTGIKKHFCRKHCEKKWKCEKCEKRYAVKSDWKAHSKICGTREYRCDCGTIFSRRDSFITHRAFCNALAEESERVITATPLLSSQPPISSPTSSSHILNNNLLQLQPQFHCHDLHPFPMKKYQHSFNLRPSENILPWPACPPVIGVGPGPPPQPQPPIDLSSSIFSTSIANHGENPSPNPSLGPTILQPYHHHPSASSSSSSATALLQKVSRMGASMITPFGNVSPAATAGAGTGAPSSLLQEMMASLSSATGFVGSEGGGDGVNEGLTFSWV